MGNCPLKFRTKQTSQGTPVSPGLPAYPADLERNLVVSLHDFPCYGVAEFSLRVGERLSVVSDDGDFLMVKSARTGHEIYVPTECTAKVINRWFFKGLSRYKAEELLMQPHNRTGAFIVRESESNPDHYSLSVLKRPESYLGSVKHYRISRIDNGWFYIAQRLTFSSLQHLVEHYTGTQHAEKQILPCRLGKWVHDISNYFPITEFADGLCCTLDKPCFILGSDNTTPTINTQSAIPLPLAIRRPTMNWKDISRSMLFRGNRAESEHSLVSDGLREAISSYLYMTEIHEDFT